MADNQGGNNHIWLFNLAKNSRRIISGNNDGSMPVVSGSWVVWKDAPRYDYGNSLTIFNLDSGNYRHIETCPVDRNPSDPNILEQWVSWTCTWKNSDEIYAYHLPNGKEYVITPPSSDQGIGSLHIDDGWISWTIVTNTHESGGKTIFQWAKLSQ